MSSLYLHKKLKKKNAIASATMCFQFVLLHMGIILHIKEVLYNI
jgi:hypothetical protein